MGKGLLFFCCSCCILVLTIVNLSIGPITSGKMLYFSEEDWGTLNCGRVKDEYDVVKDANICKDDCLKYNAKWSLDECKRKKGMHDMEYTAFIFDIVIGFVCVSIGFLHLFDIKKEFVSTTGLIGLVCGFVGFVLTFVYVILNGLVYTTVDTPYYKMDGDGAFAELKGDKYECFYYDKPENRHSLIAKLSDLNKKQYNYNKDLLEKYLSNEVLQCTRDPDICLQSDNGNIAKGDTTNGGPFTYTENSETKDCKYLYSKTHEIHGYPPSSYPEIEEWRYEIYNKDISDRFLTVLILSLFVCLANIGLALFGFLLFRTPNDF